jgi:NAD+ synthase
MIKDIPGLLAQVKFDIKRHADMATIGLSGGADSTLVALLCVQALGKENVVGVHMPFSALDDSKFNARSMEFATDLGVNQYTVNISDPVNSLIKANGGSEISVLNKGNMKSRMRMVTLYTINCKLSEGTNKRCRVIGTGNLSEDFIGYDTKGGDALADFFPIGMLFKSEVYQLLDYFISAGVVQDRYVDRVPSAGLWDGQTDEGELGYTYKEMQESIVRIMKGNRCIDRNNRVDVFVEARHITNEHKHQAPPVSDLRSFCDE